MGNRVPAQHSLHARAWLVGDGDLIGRERHSLALRFLGRDGCVTLGRHVGHDSYSLARESSAPPTVPSSSSSRTTERGAPTFFTVPHRAGPHESSSTPGVLRVMRPVQRHRGEPGHTRDRHKNLTNQVMRPVHVIRCRLVRSWRRRRMSA